MCVEREHNDGEMSWSSHGVYIFEEGEAIQARALARLQMSTGVDEMTRLERHTTCEVPLGKMGGWQTAQRCKGQAGSRCCQHSRTYRRFWPTETWSPEVHKQSHAPAGMGNVLFSRPPSVCVFVCLCVSSWPALDATQCCRQHVQPGGIPPWRKRRSA